MATNLTYCTDLNEIQDCLLTERDPDVTGAVIALCQIVQRLEAENERLKKQIKELRRDC